jgi:hypothetical protein
MCRKPRHGDFSRHRESALEQRPIKCLSVECNEYGTFRDAFCQFAEHGMFISEIAHEKLLDLKAARVPPANSD